LVLVNFAVYNERMADPYDTNTLMSAIQDRVLNRQQGCKFLEQLINAARLDKALLKVSSCESIIFRINPELVHQQKPLTFDRLTLVYPESFEFYWQLTVSGYFLVKYKSLPQPLPQQLEPFSVGYSGIIILDSNSFRFKNERVQLVLPD